VIRRSSTTRRVATIAATLTATLAVAPSAFAGGDHDGHHSHDHGSEGLALTDDARETLDAFDVDVRLVGGGDHHDGYHRGGHGDHGSVGIAFVGDDATAKWSKIRVDDDSDAVTALVNGDRVTVLVAEKASGRHGDDHDGVVLDLTTAGASSLDKAAGADAFVAGDDFATTGGDC
jgi:hypothetical protein